MLCRVQPQEREHSYRRADEWTDMYMGHRRKTGKFRFKRFRHVRNGEKAPKTPRKNHINTRL